MGYILKLPEELLGTIILEAATWPDAFDNTRFYTLYADRWAWTLVCCRFYRIATSILYGDIALTLGDIVNRRPKASHDYDYPAQPQDRAIVLLHRTIQDNPSLSLLCTSLIFDMEHPAWHREGPSSHLLSKAKDLVAWLSNTTYLRLHQAFVVKELDSTSALLERAAEKMFCLERLSDLRVLNGVHHPTRPRLAGFHEIPAPQTVESRGG